MLNVVDLHLHYGASHALRGVSLEAMPGRISCVLGRNGVGKSSLLRTIMGINTASGGEVRWEGAVLGRMPPYDRARRGIGYVPQGREIFPRLTVAENLEAGLAAASRGAKIPDDVFLLFPVLGDMLKRRGGDLSGGQQQQLAIARALVAKPRLLILDEPTEGIQPSIIKDIGRVLKRLASDAGMAILLVEQYFDFARDLADRFFVMDRGEVVLSGEGADMTDAKIRRYLTV